MTIIDEDNDVSYFTIKAMNELLGKPKWWEYLVPWHWRRCLQYRCMLRACHFYSTERTGTNCHYEVWSRK